MQDQTVFNDDRAQKLARALALADTQALKAQFAANEAADEKIKQMIGIALTAPVFSVNQKVASDE
ncbi:hypothetical protein [Orrella sp. 11846]|uniref:hypothetical protein n=1 Tax=Orrella sp. 11846 TaxID=3409913 RepID=UPI003B5C720B